MNCSHCNRLFQQEMLIHGWLRCEKLIVPSQEIYDIECEKFTHAYAGTRICTIVTFTRTLWDDFL